VFHAPVDGLLRCLERDLAEAVLFQLMPGFCAHRLPSSLKGGLTIVQFNRSAARLLLPKACGAKCGRPCLLPAAISVGRRSGSLGWNVGWHGNRGRRRRIDLEVVMVAEIPAVGDLERRLEVAGPGVGRAATAQSRMPP